MILRYAGATALAGILLDRRGKAWPAVAFALFELHSVSPRVPALQQLHVQQGQTIVLEDTSIFRPIRHKRFSLYFTSMKMGYRPMWLCVEDPGRRIDKAWMGGRQSSA